MADPSPLLLRLAVVDDDLHVRSALKRLLCSCGHEVIVFSSAEDFLARQVDADCMILDLQLPGIGGLDLEARMRGAGSVTPIVFITALDDTMTREAILRTGMPWLRKPFDEEGLLNAIARAMKG